MKKLIIIFLLAFVFIMVGCQHGDFKASLIIEGQPAEHDGYNVGPDLYLEQGDIAKVSGAIIWIKGLDPNSLTK